MSKVIIKKTVETKLGMDTNNEKEGLHLYMFQYVDITYDDGTTSSEITSISVHKNRQECRELRDEINNRLFK